MSSTALIVSTYLIHHTLVTYYFVLKAKRRRRRLKLFGYFLRPSVVVDIILGKPQSGDGFKVFEIFREFQEKLFQQTGLDRDRFVMCDLGVLAGYCIVLGSNAKSIPSVAPEVAEKVKVYLSFLGEFVEGPRWFAWPAH